MPCPPFNLGIPRAHPWLLLKTGLFSDRIMCSNSVIIHGRVWFVVLPIEGAVFTSQKCGENGWCSRVCAGATSLSSEISSVEISRWRMLFVSVVLVWLFPSFAAHVTGLQCNELHQSFFHQNSQSFRFLDPGIKASIVRACGLCSEWNSSSVFLFFIYGIIVFIICFILFYSLIFSVVIFLQRFYTST